MSKAKRISAVVLVSLVLLLPHVPSVDAAPQDAIQNYAWSFPRDHGVHPTYQVEWWYYTGQLYSEGKEPFKDTPRYGFQLTFFRKQLDNGETNEYLAHAVLTDIEQQQTYFSSRQGGALLGVSGSSVDTMQLWSGDWTADLLNNDQHLLRFSVAPKATTSPMQVRLVSTSAVTPWLQGEGGFSRKGHCSSCASQYYSLAGLPVAGDVLMQGTRESVRGIAWMDHEFMSNTLSSDQVGWDWLGLMLKDGRKVMLFRLRDEAGGTSYISGGVSQGAQVRVLSEKDLSLEPIGSAPKWSSKVSGAQYPLVWRVRVPSEGIDVVVKARVEGCEIGDGANSAAPLYWEGPVAAADESVVGYLEMTGYAGKVRLGGDGSSATPNALVLTQ